MQAQNNHIKQRKQRRGLRPRPTGARSAPVDAFFVKYSYSMTEYMHSVYNSVHFTYMLYDFPDKLETIPNTPESKPPESNPQKRSTELHRVAWSAALAVDRSTHLATLVFSMRVDARFSLPMLHSCCMISNIIQVIYVILET